MGRMCFTMLVALRRQWVLDVGERYVNTICVLTMYNKLQLNYINTIIIC